MLVLSRKAQQQIKIGDNVTITILLIKGSTVRVGIEAPSEVRVLRAELPAKQVAQRMAAPVVGRRAARVAAAGDAPSAVSPPLYAAPRTESPQRSAPSDGPLSRLRRRAPGACDATLIPLQERLGPASLRALGSRRF